MSATPNLNVPNCVTAARIALVPVMLYLAWSGRTATFTIVLVIALLGDILDGYLARTLNQKTSLGAQLDSWGDLFTSLVYAPAAAWLRPDALSEIAPFVFVAVVAYLAPIVFGFFKFRRLTSYHTRLTTVAAYFVGFAVVCFFAGWSNWPFRAACLLLVISQVEEVLISALLPIWTANVRDYGMALALRRETAIGLITRGDSGEEERSGPYRSPTHRERGKFKLP